MKESLEDKVPFVAVPLLILTVAIMGFCLRQSYKSSLRTHELIRKGQYAERGYDSSEVEKAFREDWIFLGVPNYDQFCRRFGLPKNSNNSEKLYGKHIECWRIGMKEADNRIMGRDRFGNYYFARGDKITDPNKRN